MSFVILARHGQSVLNLTGHVNGDPSVSVALTAQGEAEARRLGTALDGVQFDLCVHSRFERTRRTAELALGGRGVPLREEPLFDDIDVGELEGQSVDDYRAWKAAHGRADAVPGGESLDDAARRYATALRGLLDAPRRVLVICHEIPLRYALNAAAGSGSLDGPAHEIGNAVPYLFSAARLRVAAERIESLAA